MVSPSSRLPELTAPCYWPLTCCSPYMKACRGHKTCHRAPKEEDHRNAFARTCNEVEEHILTLVDRQPYPCMSRHRLAGSHPRGYNFTEAGGASQVRGRGWLDQVLALLDPSPTIAASPPTSTKERRDSNSTS